MLIGDVAQLARALDWQSRGRGFESHLLHQSGILLISRQRSAFYLFLYNFKLAITPKIEHKLYEIFIDQSSTRKLPNNGSSIISARVHKICANKKKINAIKNNNPILFIVQT